MFKQRRSRRRSLVYYLRVMERDSKKLIGQLVDITDEGMRLVTEEPISPGAHMQLQILLPRMMNRKAEIGVDGECMWCKPDVNPDYYGSGFQFDGLSEEDMEALESLIYGCAFQE